jgi:hypothetical protein
MASLRASRTTLLPMCKKEPPTRGGPRPHAADRLNARQRRGIHSRMCLSHRRQSPRSRSIYVQRYHHHHPARRRTRKQPSRPDLHLHRTQPHLLQKLGQQRSKRRVGLTRPKKHRHDVVRQRPSDLIPLGNLLWCSREVPRPVSPTD